MRDHGDPYQGANQKDQMKHQYVATVLTVIALVSVSVVPLIGQTQAFDGPQTPDGRPDLSGVWDFRTVTPLERPAELAKKEFFTEEEAAAFASQRARESNVDLNRATTATGRKVVNGTPRPSIWHLPTTISGMTRVTASLAPTARRW